jgi:phosphoadenosine phosphosulfate reductase
LHLSFAFFSVYINPSSSHFLLFNQKTPLIFNMGRRLSDDESIPNGSTESGYASASSSSPSIPEVYFTKPHLKYINKKLSTATPQEILQWALLTFPNLYQTTAFGLTGLVTIDMLSKLNQKIDLIFLDTLYHFTETHDLVSRIRERYPDVNLHIYKPDGVSTASEFETKYGERLWETDDNMYDYLAKVEPAERAYSELNVQAVLTGRRRSQGGKRGDLDIVEVDDAGLIKINPLANWTFKEVDAYIKANDVPKNALLDQGYKSVGDWHSTQPVKEGEDERAGRWKGQAKTECGIHNPRSAYAQFLQQQALEQALQEQQVSA